MTNAAFAAARARLPDAPALVAGVREAVWVSEAGEAETLSLGAVAERVRRGAAPIVCHARAVARRLQLAGFDGYDVLELFAFARPARFCVPTPRGLAQALLLPPPESRDEVAAASPPARCSPT
jgi:ATP-dependent DNA helicase DinG